jgi:biotin carboxyl carrier protein
MNGERTGLNREGIDIIEVEPGTYSVIYRGRSVSVVRDGAAYVMNGVRLPMPVDPRDWSAQMAGADAGGPQKIASQMPGRVVRLLVALDEEVAAGQGVIVVEAMKMQNEMKAARAGRVAAIHVKEGDPAAAGEVLVTIE